MSLARAVPRLRSSAAAALPTGPQRRWARVHNVVSVPARYLATQPAAAVVEKYREKLAAKARREGLPDVDALREAYRDQIAQRRHADAIPLVDRVAIPDALPVSKSQPQPAAKNSTAKTETSSATEKSTTTATQPTKSSSKVPPTESSSGVQPLTAFLDLDKARKLPVRELTAVWRLRHAHNAHSLCAVLPAATYAVLDATATAHPQFVLPVPHPDQGAEMHFVQWLPADPATRSRTVLLTHLAEYKARGEFAQPHTTLTHYTDLADRPSSALVTNTTATTEAAGSTDCDADAGVVLMYGQVVPDRGTSVANAQFLSMCLTKFYAAGAEATATASAAQGAADPLTLAGVARRRQLLHWFTHGDERFVVDQLLEEVERMVSL